MSETVGGKSDVSRQDALNALRHLMEWIHTADLAPFTEVRMYEETDVILGFLEAKPESKP